MTKLELLDLCINNTEFSINNPDSRSVEERVFISKEAYKNGIAIEHIADIMGLAFRTVKNYIDN